MILGIKVGPQKQSLLYLEETRAPFAEVWFNVNRAPEYTELLDELKRKKMQVGLHFWGGLKDGTLANIAYPDPAVYKASAALVQHTIDLAARYGFSYVNIHPGARARATIDLVGLDYPTISQPAALPVAEQTFLENASKLSAYATSRGVILTVETVSARVPKTKWYEPTARLQPFQLYELSVESIQNAANLGIAVANDFGHSAAIIADDAKVIWSYLKDKTQALAPQTRLVHLGFVVPPYNGTYGFSPNLTANIAKTISSPKKFSKKPAL